MSYNGMQFEIGNQVKITHGQYTGQTGKVDLTYASMTKYGFYEKVWVRLDETIVMAFSPEQLLQVSPAIS